MIFPFARYLRLSSPPHVISGMYDSMATLVKQTAAG